MAAKNIRVKGASGEREIADIFNRLIYNAAMVRGMTEDEAARAFGMVQRNQNQSAVGGADLINTMGLSVEVKRQETLALGAWWNQCTAAAERNGDLPLLLFRQSRRPWRAMTLARPIGYRGMRCEPRVVIMDNDQWQAWLAEWIGDYFDNGGTVVN